MRTVVFDLDGTLADTSADLICAANACFAARGLGDLLHRTDDALIAFHGGRAMLQAGYSRHGWQGAQLEDAIAQDYAALLQYYDANICQHTTLYPGAYAAVQTLRDTGYKTAICTNKPEGLARTLVDQLGIADLFDALIGADTLPTRKPDPQPYIAAVQGAGGSVQQSFLIGDTDTDRRTAAAVDVPSVLVTFGPTGQDILRLAPDAALHSYAQLPALTAQLLGTPAHGK
ncbi:haloacid dehalogenase [Thioclava sp. SK-1]|uniref:HAD hydrolase-like protein n=1 Tax=Thioclava sp. SK-1 TaxID=1889770 RepID=UPI0008256ADD|nr:HAD hydrolase-like protein [Thioclava sp. SK-1]OCX61149.1 haloacid dehalogenase [Thioclava sp. SK-1]